MKLPAISFLFLSLTCIFSSSIRAQGFVISEVYVDANDSSSIYSIEIRNTANDSLIVLHTQESSLPPFINNYKIEIKSNNKMVIYLGKGNNPLVPEKYRATTSLAPNSVMTLYFKVNKDKIKGEKELDIWYSMMDKKYLGAFKKLDTSNSISDMKRCRKLKEKYGVVHHKVIAFK